MKKLFLAILSIMFLVACGGNKPEDIAKNFIEYTAKGDIEKMMTYLEIPDKEKEMAKGKLTMLSADFASKVEKNGGLNKVEVISSDIEGDYARVKLKMSLKNGSSKEENIRLYKKNDKWFIKL